MDTNKILQIKPLGFPWETQDPFLFCAYHRDEYPKGNETLGLSSENLGGRNIGQDFVVKDGFRMYHGSNIPGFPYHPHRGFETITINKDGSCVSHGNPRGLICSILLVSIFFVLEILYKDPKHWCTLK